MYVLDGELHCSVLPVSMSLEICELQGWFYLKLVQALVRCEEIEDELKQY